MVAIKSYTDIEQSKKLAEILPLESADMYYNLGESNIPNFIYGSHSDFGCYLPCWSLAALLGVLPNTIGRYNKALGWFDNAWHCDYMDEDSESMGNDTLSNNPVDACYKMIIHLNELNLL